MKNTNKLIYIQPRSLKKLVTQNLIVVVKLFLFLIYVVNSNQTNVSNVRRSDKTSRRGNISGLVKGINLSQYLERQRVINEIGHRRL